MPLGILWRGWPAWWRAGRDAGLRVCRCSVWFAVFACAAVCPSTLNALLRQGIVVLPICGRGVKGLAKKPKKRGKQKSLPAQAAQLAPAPQAPPRRSSGGVPGLDAFDNLPKRRPPGHQQPFEQPEETLGAQGMKTRVAAPKKKGGKKQTAGRAQAEAQAKPRRQRPVKPVNAARRRRNRRIAAVAALVVLIAAGAWFSITVLFKIDKFEVQGESRYTAEELAEVFGHSPGDNMYGFSADNAEKRIEAALPYIEQVTIRRRLPSTIVFKVTEAVETFCVPWQGQYAVLSGQMKVLRMAAEEPAGLLRIEGLSYLLVEVGQPLALDEATVKALGLDTLAQGSSSALPASDAGAGSSLPASTSGGDGGDSADTQQEDGADSQALAAAQPTAGGHAPTPVESFEVLGLLLEALAKAGFEEVSFVDVGDVLNLRFGWQGRVTVLLGPKSNLTEKLNAAYKLLQDEIGPEAAGTLDMTYHTNTGTVYWKDA